MSPRLTPKKEKPKKTMKKILNHQNAMEWNWKGKCNKKTIKKIKTNFNI